MNMMNKDYTLSNCDKFNLGSSLSPEKYTSSHVISLCVVADSLPNIAVSVDSAPRFASLRQLPVSMLLINACSLFASASCNDELKTPEARCWGVSSASLLAIPESHLFSPL